MCFICNLLYKCSCDHISKEVEGNFESLDDHPIEILKNDRFFFQERYINKIQEDLEKISFNQMTIALTGEWGSGKTSLINLLQAALKIKNKRNIIINFEPQIEGKLQVSEIISLFYLKLYKHVQNKKHKEYIKACLTGLSISSNVKLISTIGIPGLFSIGAEFDPDKSVKKMIDAYNEETPKEFVEQAKKISKILIDEGIKLYVFIDEIDRLPEDQMINFLIFCRNLELIKNSVCFLGMDYEQVLWKLMHEKFGVNSVDNQVRYKRAKTYLDKLFQSKHIISTDTYALHSFLLEQLEKIDSDSCLRKFYQSPTIHHHNDEFLNAASYLGTPRQVKKWLIAIRSNYEVIKYARQHKAKIILFLAISTKHPVITDYLAKNASTLLRYHGALSLYAKDFYGISIGDFDQDTILLASIGFIKFPEDSCETKQGKLIKLMNKMDVHPIDDLRGARNAISFLKIPLYLILLLVQGSKSKKNISIYSEYFEGDVDSVLIELQNQDTQEFVVLAQNLASDLYTGGISPVNLPSLNTVDFLWESKVNLNSNYEPIILYSIRKYPIETIISDCLLGISEAYLNEVLSVCSVVNLQAAVVYDLEKSNAPTEDQLNKKCFTETKFKDKFLKDFKNTGENDALLNDILNCWLEKADKDFSSLNPNVFNQPKIISIFYRYNQWTSSIKKNDSQTKLANFVIRYLKQDSIDHINNDILVTSLNNEIQAFSKQGVFGEGDPMNVLFGNQSNEIISLLDGFQKIVR